MSENILRAKFDIQLRGGFRTRDPRLDRVPQFDPKSRRYAAAVALPMSRPCRTVMWDCSQILDQGKEGACVGFAWTYELIAEPFPTTGLSDATAQEIYQRAKQLDDFAGEDYEGSSVLGGAKVLAEKAFLTEYRWAFTFDEMCTALSYRGPVVLGVAWYESMYETAADGFVRIAGAQVGGHAIMARGLNMERQAVVLRNSWGPSWGGGGDLGAGDAYLSFDDTRRLLAEDGECCVPIIRE